MYQYIFDEDTTKKINNSTNGSKSILDQFTDIDNKYANIGGSNTSLNLEKKTYAKPSSQEVEQTAKNSLESYKNSSINSINDNFDEKNSKLDEEINNVKESSAIMQENIKNNYNNVKQEAKEDAIKRGLARSSIIVNTLAGLDNSMLGAINDNITELNNTIASYKTQKDNLEIEKQNALNSFNIEYAVKLQDKIDEINTSISKKEEEILEYNNKIAAEQAEWDKDMHESNLKYSKDLIDLYSKYGESVFDIIKQVEKYNLANKHFSNMSKADAIRELENNSAYKDQLGRNLYNKLYSSIKAK